MRPLLLLLACVAAAAAQVQYAEQAPPARAVVRRRRVRPRRPLPAAEQQGEPQTLVPFNQGPPPSRQPFRPEPQPFRPEPQPFRPEPQFRPQFQPDEFRSPQELAPVPTKSQARPTPSAPSRSASRFKAQQEADFADYSDAAGVQEEEEEDYAEEPDRLAELLAVSTFKCDPSATGYYADDSVNCEVFHYCAAGVKHSWVCPNGNSFHQINLICQPQSADNICQRSNEFTFVNDYLYQQISNDTRKPQYADRYYPDASAAGEQLLSRPEPQPSYQQRQPEQDRRRRPLAQSADFGSSGNGFGSSRPSASSRPSSSSFPNFQQAQALGGRSKPSAYRPEQADFRGQQTGFRRSGDEPVLPPVGPSPFLGQVGASALQPDIRSRGAPLPQERHDDRIVLGGFQGNVDIEDLASRRQ
ncbi:alpha/beta-gliadin MM1-like [Amphibalanus amphitrite]|uniref:alpha/beta-gliadin MM1-like n=1 Tax=Amphibalanus amphitrite TaxID=1232801 RepID=UPI001C8FD1A0|nr:alpha/beta-gliadin MM1-like [Amphibalanus amphitrite]